MRGSSFSSRSSSRGLITCLASILLGLCGEARVADRPSLAEDGLPAGIQHALSEITSKEVLGHARLLSDPKFRGREASSAEARGAAKYIAEEFRRLGLHPGGHAGSYFQSFKIRLGYRISSELEVRIGDTVVGDPKRGTDYMPLHLPDGKADLSASCALVGYGISSEVLKFDEYADLDAKGKVAVVFSGTPWSPETAQWLRLGPDARAFETLAHKAKNAAAHGAVCLLVVDNPAGWRKQLAVPERLRVPDRELVPQAPIPIVQVTREFLVTLTGMSSDELRLLALDIGQDRAPCSLLLRGRTIRFKAAISGQAKVGRNVVGVLSGGDQVLRKEAVVLGAHYDHLGGLGEQVYFGANDNAAGVGAILAIAQAFRALPKAPARSIVLVAFDAEEIGKLGSRNYVAKPCIPISKTVLMINFDMIGKNEPNQIYAVATRSSPELHEIHQQVNAHVGLTLHHPPSFRLGRSDHTYFYYAGVPVMYLFGGTDQDYNTPRDTWDKLIPDKVEKVARLAFLTALDVANREVRPRFLKTQESGPTGLPRE